MKKVWNNIYFKIFGISALFIFVTFLMSLIWSFIYRKGTPYTINIFNLWDTVHYLYIAKYGYCTSKCIPAYEQFSIVFFPLYSLLIRFFQFFTHNYMLGALVVSNVFYILTILFLYKLVRKDFSHEISLRAILLLSAFPTAYFLHFGYTESLFLFLVVSSFYYAINKKWLTASLLGMLASLARINGILLFPAILIEYLIGHKEVNKQSGIKIKKDIFYTVLIPIGSLLYLFINYVHFHNPFQFMIFQKEHWGEYFSSPITGLMGDINGFHWRPINEWLNWTLPQIIFAFFAVIIILLSAKKIRLSYSIYSFLSLIILVCCSFWMSIPRFVVVIFPIFIFLALILRKRRYFYPTILFFIILQIFFLTRFLSGQWAF